MADPANTSLAVRDGGGAAQNLYTYSNGGVLMPAHISWGWDGSSTPHAILVDSSGRQVSVGAAAAGSAIAGNPVLTGGSDGTNARATLVDTSGRPVMVGPETAGSAVVGGGQRVMGSDGTNARDLLTDTTGKLLLPFTRYLTVRGHFTPLASASYATATCVGGIITVATGLPAATPVLEDTIDWIVEHATSVATGLGVIASLFNSSPTGTWTDGSTVVWSVADIEQRVDTINLAGAAQANASIGSLGAATRGRLTTVDGSGNLYLGLYAAAAPTYVGTPTAAWTVQLRY